MSLERCWAKPLWSSAVRRSGEYAEDIKEIEENLRAIKVGKKITAPGEVTFAILDGINPIRAWRKKKANQNE